MSGFQRVCPSCDRLCGPNALFCIDCGTALVTPEAVQEGLAAIRAATRERRVKANAAASVRTAASNRGAKWRRCPWCGRRCRGATCAGCRDLAMIERELDLL